MTRLRGLAAVLSATSMSLVACVPFAGDSDDDGSEGDLAASVEAADALATEGLEALDSAVRGARWAGPSSTLERCGGDFDVASYSVNGSLLATGATDATVAAAWEDAGLDVDTGGDDPTVARDGATMTFTAGPEGSDAGRFQVRVDCTRADGDVIDELGASAPKDLGEELGLRQDPAFG